MSALFSLFQGYLGFELWSLVNNLYFDDILVTDSDAVSNEWTEKTWALKKQSIAAESVSSSFI